MMQENLIQLYHDYIRDNHPDLLLILQEENRLRDYLHENVASLDELITQLVSEEKPIALIEQLCMEELTKPLRPSRYNYLKEILEEDFPTVYERFRQHGILTTELINLVTACDEVFDELNFSEENEDDRYLRYAIVGAVHEYLNSQTRE
jgi:hypothetical protein